MKDKSNGRSAMTRSKGTSHKGGSLQKDDGGHQVPGFLKGESVPMAKARTYTQWSDRTGESAKGTKITLP